MSVQKLRTSVKRSDHPASEKAVGSRGIANYMPSVGSYETPRGIAWAVSVGLPRETYKKWIPKLAGNKNFREIVEDDITVLFNGNLEEPNYIKILWNERGVIFETFGNACDVAIEGNDFDLTEYGGHNIDNSKQALVLYGCLSIYMKHIMEHLDFCERNPEVYSGWPDVEEGVVSLISFNKKGLAKLARR